MANVTYNPRTAGEAEFTEVFGHFFEVGEAVDVKDERILEKLRGNPEFEVEGTEPAAEDEAKRESAERREKALDGRTKEARAAKEKADKANADADAKARAVETVQAIDQAARQG